jgi:hypothetical protein
MTATQPVGAAAEQLAQRVLDLAARRSRHHLEVAAAERAEAHADLACRWAAAALPGCAAASRATLDDPDRQAIHDRWADAGRRSNLLLFGAPGRGKTYLACACAHTALTAGDRIACWRTSKLLRATAGPAPDTTLLRTAAAAHILLLDDPGLPPLTPHQAGVLLELIDDRHSRATLITTNLQPDQLRAAVTDPVYSRLTAGAIAVELAGPDRRVECAHEQALESDKKDEVQGGVGRLDLPSPLSSGQATGW